MGKIRSSGLGNVVHMKELENLLRGYIGENVPIGENEDLNRDQKDYKSMVRVGKDFFARRADKVAQDLLGRTIVVELPNGKYTRGRITEVAAYEGATKTTSEGALYAPGVVSVSTKFGQNLVDIATGRGNSPSCVTLRAAEFDTKRGIDIVEGPGKLSSKLGINPENKAFYDGLLVGGRYIQIIGQSIDADQIRVLAGTTSNCLGRYKC